MKLVSGSGKNNKQRIAHNTGGKRVINKYEDRGGAAPVVRVNPADSGKAAAINKSKESAKETAPKRKTGARTAVIILSVIIACFAALFIALGFYVSSLDTVFPNVWAEGVNMSGLTLAETSQTLIDKGYENRADGISVTVVFPDESSFSVSGQEVGLSLSAAEAAANVFAFGRDGSFLKNELTYIRALFTQTDLYDLSQATFNDSIVRERAAEYTLQFNETLMDNSLEMDDEKITIVKGTGFETAIEDEVFDLAVFTFQRAIDDNTHLTADYLPKVSMDEAINLQIIFDIVHLEPVSAEYDAETISATESSTGRTFDLEEAEEMLRKAEKGSTIVIPILVVEPELSHEELESMLFRDVLGERTTNVAGTSNRFHNVTLATGFVDDTLLNPGELFSFNEIVGNRTSARGFQEANAYVGGLLQQEIGGGICQVSSTIYGALLYTDLEVVERKSHGMIVAYMKDKDGNTVHGQDATVAWGLIDFKFRNNTELPIRVEAKLDGRELTVKLIGTKMVDTYIELEYVEISRTAPNVEYRDDDTMYIGEESQIAGGMFGIVAETYRNHFTAEGVLIERSLVKKDTYRVQNRIILRGTVEPPPTVIDPEIPETQDPSPGEP